MAPVAQMAGLSVKNNVRIEKGNCYYVGDSPDGKKIEGFGTTYFKDGNRYEGEHKNNKAFNGTGNM